MSASVHLPVCPILTELDGFVCSVTFLSWISRLFRQVQNRVLPLVTSTITQIYGLWLFTIPSSFFDTWISQHHRVHLLRPRRKENKIVSSSSDVETLSSPTTPRSQSYTKQKRKTITRVLLFRTMAGSVYSFHRFWRLSSTALSGPSPRRRTVPRISSSSSEMEEPYLQLLFMDPTWHRSQQTTRWPRQSVSACACVHYM